MSGKLELLFTRDNISFFNKNAHLVIVISLDLLNVIAEGDVEYSEQVRQGRQRMDRGRGVQDDLRGYGHLDGG